MEREKYLFIRQNCFEVRSISLANRLETKRYVAMLSVQIAT